MLFGSCASYEYANKRKGERVVASVKKNPDFVHDLAYEQQYSSEELADAGTRGFSVLQFIDLAKDGVKMLIEMDRKKYTQEYVASQGDMYFYDNISTIGVVDPTGMQFEGIRVLRLFKDKKTGIDTALYMVLKVDTENPNEIINNSVFRLVVDTFQLNFAKAKVPGFRWYMPWSIFVKNRETVNLDMTITFTSSWMEANGMNHRNEEIGVFSLSLRNIPLRKSEDTKAYFASLHGRKLGGFSYLVPRSYGYYQDQDNQFRQCYGQGNYNFVISFKEAGKEKFVQKLLFDNTDALFDGLKKELDKD
ncbi:MAG: hypothetical protein C0592_05890 [Marinilabiliales bacterium]|nr:MAG: hypothetical protein C0592_05890 [Marinilabiliales bacterium]